MVGSAIWNSLMANGFENLIGKTSKELDLRDQQAVKEFITDQQPDAVVIAAARVGGILANDRYPYPFLLNNLVIQNNLIHASHENDVRKLIFLGSSCIYPKYADQPIREDYLLTGELEPTNQWYAVAKIAGLKLCEALRRQYGRNYVSLMPTNLYGPRDNFDLETSHVLPALIRKFHDAKENGHAPVTLWGTGSPKREFLYVEDMADAVLFCLQNDMEQNLYNVGTGQDLSIRELAVKIQTLTGHKGKIQWDTGKPDGTPRKLLDVSRMEQEGWTYSTGLEEGLRKTCRWFVKNRKEVKEVKFQGTGQQSPL